MYTVSCRLVCLLLQLAPYQLIPLWPLTCFLAIAPSNDPFLHSNPSILPPKTDKSVYTRRHFIILLGGGGGGGGGGCFTWKDT